MDREPVSALALLERYLLEGDSLPDGFSPVALLRVSNADLAALLEDPDQVRRIRERRRLDGVEQDLGRPGMPAGVALHVNLSLYADASCARVELDHPLSPAGFAGIGALSGATVVDAPAPPLGDASAAMSFQDGLGTQGPLTGLAIRFLAGRLLVTVAGVGPAGRVQPDDVLSVAAALAAHTAVRPPPVSAAELAAFEREVAPEEILRNAYSLLVTYHMGRLRPAAVLRAAYLGAARRVAPAAARAVDQGPWTSVTSDDIDAAWHDFLPAYRELVASARGDEARALAHCAATAMYADHDGHTAFFTPPLFRRFLAASRGEAYVGLGVTCTPRSPRRVLRVLPGSPAAEAGLRAGDEVLAMDGATPEDVGEVAFSLLAAGEPGEPVRLAVRRGGVAAPFELVGVRRKEPPVVARHAVIEGEIGYCEFNHFTRGDEPVERVRAALDAFDAAGCRAWILDLRFNGGGWARTMCHIAGLFVPEGSLLTTLALPDGGERCQRSRGSPVVAQRPMAVLIGPATASAAEIVAASLRDLGRAALVGEQTAGCVNGGRDFALLDLSGVRLSEFDFLIGPARASIQNVGVAPDLRVEQTTDDLAAGRDATIGAAVKLLREQA